MRQEKIIVIGAGIAGLSSALRIAETGRDVTVVDTKVDPHAPLPTATRRTIPFVSTAVLEHLGLPTESYPELRYLRMGNNRWFREQLPYPRERGIDVLSVRRTLLQQAQAHPQIELVEGKATDLQVEKVGGGERVTGVKLINGRLIQTGENGLVVVATGVDRNIIDRRYFDEHFSLNRNNYCVLGSYITSPALERQPRDTSRRKFPYRSLSALSPSEQIEEGGTDFATYFKVSRKELNMARGGNENVIATMQEITKGTSWGKFYRDARVDRVLLYTYRGDVIRVPSVGGVVLVGDALATVDPTDPTQEGGISRIDRHTSKLRKYIDTQPDLSSAIDVYNRYFLNRA